MRRPLIAANLVGLVVLGFVGWSRLPPGTPATDAAIEQVRREVEHALRVSDLPREHVVALAVNSYVVGHVSRLAYGYIESQGGPLPEGPSSAVVVEKALRAGAGICGAATQTALALYAALDVESRAVQVFYTDPSGLRVAHITTEVRYGDAWHWFDPTWGAFHRDGDVLSLMEVVRSSPEQQARTLVGSDALLWAQVDGGPMAFTAYSPLRIAVDGRTVYNR
jgi:hypothetical protein